MIKETLTEESIDDTTGLQKWIQQTLNKRSDIVLDGGLLLIPLSGDAGFRRYYRLNSKPSLLAVTASANSGTSESAAYFATLSHSLRQSRIAVPNVLTYQADDNYMLLEDFGDRIFFNELNDNTTDYLYRKALTELIKLQKIPRDRVNIPRYSQPILGSEMEFFREWFVGKLLGYSLSMQEQRMIDCTFTFLEQQALAQPQVFVHRDYHSRNLLVRQDKPLGIIDFQDAALGPVTYDLVSLLKDCYIRWPRERVLLWVENFWRQTGVKESGYNVNLNANLDKFITWFDWMGLQRHIKVLGTFARLYLRDGKPGYLDDLPLVVTYVEETLADYSVSEPASADFADWFAGTLRPLIDQQPWSQPA